MAIAPGTRLGAYEIVGLIGAGGMGEVYRARDTRLGRDVAIKILPAAFSSDPERLRRFEQEARAAAALNHPNILAVHDIGTHKGAPYIVSELLDGETLRARLAGGVRRRDTPNVDRAETSEIRTSTGTGLAVRRAIDYAIQTARGLAAAHDKGIVHRDLKPENVFVTTEGHVKILDFGLAKLMQSELAPAGATILPTRVTDTQPGVLLGTIGYMAPEQVRGLAADSRSDIFAFGAILYEMLSGSRAFSGATAADTVSAILEKDPDDLPTAERRIPPALARVVDRCLEKNPAARFQSTHDLAFALESASTQSDSSIVTAPGAPRTRRNERLMWGFAALGLVVAATTITLYLRVPSALPDRNVTRFTVIAPQELSTQGPGSVAASLAISPDGRQIAYVAANTRTGDGPQMWIRRLDAIDSRLLPGSDGATFPFWSPDSRLVGFFSQGKLKKIDVSGGGSQVICDAPNGLGGTWNRDGTILFAPSEASGLFRISAGGGQPVQVTKPDPRAQETHRWPSFLPDGRRFLYVTFPNTTIYVGSLDSSERKQIAASDSKAIYAPPGLLLFVRSNALFAQRFDLARTELVGEPAVVGEQVPSGIGNVGAGSPFAVSETGELVYRSGAVNVYSTQLTWLDRSGKAIATVGQPGDYRSVELSPDGRRVAEHPHENVGGGDTWLLDLTRGTSARFTFGGHTTDAIWSPDGTRLAFGSNRPASGETISDPYAGTFNMYEKRADLTGDATVLLDSTATGHPPTWKQPTSWSPDGRFLVYETYDPKTTWDLWMLPLTGDRKPRPLLRSDFEELEGQISPDGRWLAYTSDESKRWQVNVVPLSGGTGKWQISTDGGRLPRWRGDGKELYFLTDARKLMAVDVRTSGSALEVGIPHPLFDVQIPATFFQPTPIAQTAKTPWPYAVSRDGQRFLVAVDRSQQRAEQPITVVENWTAALKK